VHVDVKGTHYGRMWLKGVMNRQKTKRLTDGGKRVVKGDRKPLLLWSFVSSARLSFL